MIKVINSRDDSRVREIKLGQLDLVFSKHAEIRSIDKRIAMADSIYVNKGQVVEVELNEQDRMVKAVVRVEYNNANDIIYVLVPTSNSMKLLVKTVWLNKKTDNHDISLYKTERAKSFRK